MAPRLDAPTSPSGRTGPAVGLCGDEVAAAAARVPVYQGRGQPKKARPAPLHSAQEVLDGLPEHAWQAVT